MAIGLALMAALAALWGCAEYAKTYNALAGVEPMVTAPGGKVVYSRSECIGAVVNNVCQGSILPKTATHPTCYGEMINGRCTGPLF